MSLSVFDDKEAVICLKRLIPAMRSKPVFEVDLTQKDGLIQQTGNDLHHFPWWRSMEFDCNYTAASGGHFCPPTNFGMIHANQSYIDVFEHHQYQGASEDSNMARSLTEYKGSLAELSASARLPLLRGTLYHLIRWRFWT